MTIAILEAEIPEAIVVQKLCLHFKAFCMNATENKDLQPVTWTTIPENVLSLLLYDQPQGTRLLYLDR
jgi:hypothetical protein